MYLPYISADKQRVLGHYKVAQRSGSLAATIGAAGHLARIRWTDATNYCVLLRLRVGITIDGAITTATEFTLRAIIARQFTTDFTTAMTAINMSTMTNVMRSSGINAMKPSLMGNISTGGPGISTTTVMSGQTLTADAAPFAIASFQSPSTTLGAAAVTIQVGAGTPMTTLYERGADGDHPPILGQNEGIIVQPHVAGPASGTFGLYVEWSWAEVAVLP